MGDEMLFLAITVKIWAKEHDNNGHNKPVAFSVAFGAIGSWVTSS